MSSESGVHNAIEFLRVSEKVVSIMQLSFSEFLRNILPSPKVAEERLEQAKQWGFSLFKESLEKFCDDGGFIFHLLLVLLIFVFSSSSTYIKI